MSDGVTSVSTGLDLKTKLESGNSVVLSKNITLELDNTITISGGSEDSPTTLDLGGYTLTINKIDGNNSNRLIVADEAYVKITNGTIVYTKATGSAEEKSPIRVGSTIAAASAQTQTLTLDKVNIMSADYGVTAFSKGNLIVSNSNISAVASAIATNGSVADSNSNSCGVTISITGGQYTSTSTAAVFFPGGDTLTVNGGTFTGKTGFDIRSGTTKITNATINVLGSPNEVKTDRAGKTGGDGPTPWGMGVAVFNYGTYGQDISGNYTELKVIVSGTTINNAVYALYAGDYKINEEGKFKLVNTYESTTLNHACSVEYTSITGDKQTYTIDKTDINNVSSKNIYCVNGTRSVDATVPITIDVIKNYKFIFANGTGITISQATDEQNSKIIYDGNIFIDNFDLSTYMILGGSKNNNPASTNSTNITLDGGKVHTIAGGGYGSATVENATVIIKSGEATYVTGGGWATLASGPTSTDAMENKTTTANVTIENGTVGYALGGGRLQYTYVETTNLIVNGGTFKEIVAGGVNGYTGSATLTVEATAGNSITTGLISSGNRGQVSNVAVNINNLGADGSANYIAIGASHYYTKSDGGSNAIFDKIDFTISENINATNIFLGISDLRKGTTDSSNQNPWALNRTNSLAQTNITINAPGHVIKLADYVENNTELIGAEYTINSGKTWTIAENTKLELIENSSIVGEGIFTNNGIIEVNDADGLINAIAICGEIKLLEDITIAESVNVGVENYTTSLLISDIVKLDLNGHTLNLSTAGSGIFVKEKGVLTITDSSKEATGTIEYTYSKSTNATILVYGTSSSPAKLILEKGTITVKNADGATDAGYGVYASDYSEISSGKDFKIIAGYSAISGNGNDQGASITITGGEYTSKTSAVIFFPSTTKLDVTGGTFIGKTGFDIRAGTVTISNAVISLNKNEPIDKTDTSGPSSWGMGIAVIDKSAYASGTKISVSISKTTVNGATYDLYVGDLNRDADGAFIGTDGTFTANHSITVSVNGKTVYEVTADNEAERFTSNIKSSSGSGGGSGTPITPPTPPVVPEEPIVPDDKGNAEIKVDEKKAEELVHEAVTSGSNSVTLVDKENIEGTVTSVTIPVSDLETISKQIENNENVNSVSIATSVGEVIIEKEVLNDIIENANAETIVVEVVDAKDQLNEEQKKTVGDNPVYDVNIRAGSEYIKSFNGKTITVSIPYELQPGEDPNNLVVYYLKDDGTVEKMKGTYKDGQVSFETDHLSKFVIAYEAQEPVTPDNPDQPAKEDNDNTIYYIVAAIVVILIIVALAYYFLKKKQ